MWRSKKFIAIVVAAVLVIGGSVGGTLAADTGNEDECSPGTQHAAMLDRVCAIYQENTGTTIDSQALQDAFAQAQSEMREEAMQNRLQNRVEQGEIFQDEADQYLEWWQSKPDVQTGFGFRGPGFRGMGGPRGRLYACAPENH
jgi:hypothetical protein